MQSAQIHLQVSCQVESGWLGPDKVQTDKN